MDECRKAGLPAPQYQADATGAKLIFIYQGNVPVHSGQVADQETGQETGQVTGQVMPIIRCPSEETLALKEIMEHLGLGHDNFRKNYLVPAMNTNTRCHDEHLSLWRTDTRQLTFCPHAPPPRRKNDAAQQGKASTNKIGRMEASEAICPITSGKHPYADAQIPSCLVGGSRRTTSLGGCHPDEQWLNAGCNVPNESPCTKAMAM